MLENESKIQSKHMISSIQAKKDLNLTMEKLNFYLRYFSDNIQSQIEMHYVNVNVNVNVNVTPHPKTELKFNTELNDIASFLVYGMVLENNSLQKQQIETCINIYQCLTNYVNDRLFNKAGFLFLFFCFFVFVFH